jgi:hypothetical protein
LDQVTRFCTNCGHQLVVGRYCTDCGARVLVPTEDPPASTPADPVTRAAEPPPLTGPPPSSARYPLFADTVRADRPPAEPAPATHTAVASYDVGLYDVAQAPSRRSVLPWFVGLLVLAVLVVIGGGVLLIAQSGADDADVPIRSERDGQRGDTSDEGGPESALRPADVAVPGSAPASVDEAGNPVTFEADNMLDADPRTSWRMVGDGSGSVVTFTFDNAVTVTEVGLINGYAKKDPPHDWYAGNRRIEMVTWAFDDGTEVTQELGEVRELQTVDVDAGETKTIELRIVAVTDPGAGPDGRDYTAISDVEVIGTG